MPVAPIAPRIGLREKLVPNTVERQREAAAADTRRMIEYWGGLHPAEALLAFRNSDWVRSLHSSDSRGGHAGTPVRGQLAFTRASLGLAPRRTFGPL